MKSYNINWIELRDLCIEIVKKLGASEEHAFLVADALVDADLCGIESHGVSRMKNYMKRLQTGVIDAKGNYFVEKENAASLAINGNNSMGMVVGTYAMNRCIEKARESGCCFATVNNSNHYGTSAYYARMAANAGMVGFTGTNAPPNIAPWGSSQKYMGTNPMAIAVPTNNDPMVLDMAPSVVAMGKIILAAKLGKKIPEGWVLTKDGRPTTDPVEGQYGTLIPIGGPKGSGLAIFMDVLCGILSGASYGPHINHFWNDFENPQNVGHIFCAIDISKFIDLGEFKKRLGDMIGEMKVLPKNPGVDEIFMPGEIENMKKKDRKEAGLELSESVYHELKELAQNHGVPFNI